MNGFKKVPYIFQALLLVVILISAELIGSNTLVYSNYSHYFKHDVEEIIDKNEDVDMIFIGASRIYRTMVPKVFEEKLEYKNVLNAGSSYQSVYGTYYQLKYLLSKFNPQYVIVGVTWDGLLPNANLQRELIVADRLPFLYKVDYGLNCFRENILYLSNLYRFRETLRDEDVLGTCRSNYYELKSIREGTIEIDKSAQEYYADKGFVFNKDTHETGTFRMEYKSYSNDYIEAKMLRYLNKVAELCESKGIKLYFVTGPTSIEKIYAIENYQEAVDFFTQFAKEHDTEYFNLNYLVGREDFLPDELMHDSNHVNGEGAELVSGIFAEILEKEFDGEDTSEYFYSDISELKKDVTRIVSVGADISREGKTVALTAKCFTNDDIVPEYRISISADKKTYEPITDFSTETEYLIDVSGYEAVAFKIEARQQGREVIDAYSKGLTP